MPLKKKTNNRWRINVTAFILFFVLAGTGLTNWLLLPKGPAARSGIWFGLKRLVCSVHEWASVLFILVVAVHVVQHWKYIRSMLKRQDRSSG